MYKKMQTWASGADLLLQLSSELWGNSRTVFQRRGREGNKGDWGAYLRLLVSSGNGFAPEGKIARYICIWEKHH